MTLVSLPVDIFHVLNLSLPCYHALRFVCKELHQKIHIFNFDRSLPLVLESSHPRTQKLIHWGWNTTVTFEKSVIETNSVSYLEWYASLTTLGMWQDMIFYHTTFRGQLEMLKWAFDNTKYYDRFFNLNSSRGDWMELGIIATKGGQLHIIDWLYKKFGDLYMCREICNTAATLGFIDILKYFFNNDNPQLKNYVNVSIILQNAHKNGHDNIVSWLYNTDPILTSHILLNYNF